MLDIYYSDNYNGEKTEDLVSILLCANYGLCDNIEYERDRFGKPYIKNRNFDLKFNVSHTGNIWVCCVSDNEVGVDVESVKRPVPLIVISKLHLQEVKYIRSSDVGLEGRFWDIWTKKEAYVKYLGSGFKKELNSFNTLEKTFFKTALKNRYIINVFSGSYSRVVISRFLAQNL